jgi:hypothetical protein
MFQVDLGNTRFAGYDYLDLFSDSRALVGSFSAGRPLVQNLNLVHSNAAILVLRSTSDKTKFSLRYTCNESDEIKFFGHYFTPTRFIFMVVTSSMVIIFVFVVLPVGYCWHRRATRVAAEIFQHSLVVLHAEHQRQLAADEEVESKTMKQLQELPMQTWRIKEESNADHPDCCLCLEPFKAEDRLRVLPCSHYFHKECVDKWFASRRFRPRSCPTCRSNPLVAVASTATGSPTASSEGPDLEAAPSIVAPVTDVRSRADEVVVEDMEESRDDVENGATICIPGSSPHVDGNSCDVGHGVQGGETSHSCFRSSPALAIGRPGSSHESIAAAMPASVGSSDVVL